MFQFLFECTADAVWLIDPVRGAVADCNEAAAVLMRCSCRAELVGRRLEELSATGQKGPSLTEEVAQRITQTCKNGDKGFEWALRRFDGTEVPLKVNAAAIERDGKSLIMLVSRDISKRKEGKDPLLENEAAARLITAPGAQSLCNASAVDRWPERQPDDRLSVDKVREIVQQAEAGLRESEARLRESEERFSKAFRASPALMTISRSRDEKYVEVNDAFVRWYGLRREDILGHSTKELGTWLHLEDRAKFWADLKRNGSVREVECQARRRGGVGTLLVSADIIDINGEPHVIATGLDITERKQAEAELRESEARLRESEARFSAAFRASPALISLLRLSDGKFVEVNDAFAQWLGMDPDRIVGHDTLELGVWVNCDEREKFLANLRRNGSMRDVECRFRTRRGSVHTIVLSAEIIEINREPHILGFGIDVTERKRAELELLRTLARERQFGQLRSHIVSMVSHEFRTPLGIIQSSAEILEDYLEDLGPAERKEHLQSIRKNTRRMARLMEEALLLGSLDAGKMEFKPAPLELRTFVRRLVDEVLSATSRRCPVELLLTEIPIKIRADERLLQHIFTNLLTNAIKYSDAGQLVHFEIGCAEAELVCVVRDEGIGIAEADKEWLFNAFHRGLNVNDRPGTGLGLVIVKRCIELHGGKIKVESQIGAGTVVTVRLPMCATESSVMAI
jgi:PAS domain S-box-containing protein